MDLGAVPGHVPDRLPLRLAFILQSVDAAMEFWRRPRGGHNSRRTSPGIIVRTRVPLRLAVVPLALIALAPSLRAEGPSRVIISVKEQKLMLMSDGARIATYPISTSK